jgi:hypothetical protein
MSYFGHASYFSPGEMRMLHDALDLAWRTLKARDPDIGRDHRERFVKLTLALGVLGAAATGERDVARLSAKACELWESRLRVDDEAPAPAVQRRRRLHG